MTAASASPTFTSLPERAFSLHCSGLRSPAIAAQLGVPERTVRAWIARIRDDLAAEETALLRDEFLRAVEHLHQLSAAAWAAFEDEQAASHLLPNDPHADLPSAETATREPSLASVSAAAPLSPQGAARAEGSDVLGVEQAIVEVLPAAPAAARLRPQPLSRGQKKGEGRTGQGVRFPAESATGPSDTETEIPAKTATESLRPPSSSSCSPWLNPHLPTKPATPPHRPVTPRAFPSSIPIHWRMWH